MHIEFLVEEASAEAALRILLPKMIGDEVSFEIHVHQGKQDLLDTLPFKLRGYASWITDDYRIVVLVDRDDDECRALKSKLEDYALQAGLPPAWPLDGPSKGHLRATCWGLAHEIFNRRIKLSGVESSGY